MLSLIVSSISNETFSAFNINVSDTIGCIHEIIRIENSNGKMGICEAYNTGALKAQYPFLCFVHEDVLFKTQQWGNNLIAHLQSDDVGIAGVAGSIYKGRMVSGWWQRFRTTMELDRMNFTQHFKYKKQNSEKRFSNPCNENASEVITLDGVMLAMKKQTWIQHPFDQNLLSGFHGYDLDISLTVGRFLKNIVMFDIDLVHLSEGSADLSWFYSLLKVHYKFRKTLPRMHIVQNQRLLPVRQDWDTVSLYGQKMIDAYLPVTQLIPNTYKLITLIDYNTATGTLYIKGLITTILTLIWRLVKRKRKKPALLS